MHHDQSVTEFVRVCPAVRVLRGQASPQEILDSQERFDNHFMASPVRQAACEREAGRPS